MDLLNISLLRFCNQQIANSETETPEKLLHWMGVMQAQHYEMVKWAMGVRLPGSSIRDIEKAIEDGRIIRTHLLRPTWHFAAAEDLRWMLDLTAPRVRAAIGSFLKRPGMTKEVTNTCNKIIEKALTDNDQMTRKELVGWFESAGFNQKDNHASLLLINAELDGVICSGPTIGKNYTYALFDKRIPPAPRLNRDEALAKLAKIYFQSHGPATLEDFIWWSGLTKTGAKKALDFIKGDVISEKINSQTHWFFDSAERSLKPDDSVQLLPPYDEFLISYKDRSASIRIKDKKKAISNNGIFRPIIVVNGEVLGIWKRSIKKKDVCVETQFFKTPSRQTILRVEEAAKKFADFLGKGLKINHIIDS